MLAGGLIQLGQGFYFQALEKTEAGIVAAYGNFTPTLLPLAGYFLMGDVLQPWHYITIGVLVIASICFCLIDLSRNGKWDSVFLMLTASTAQVAAILIEKYVFEQGTFLISFAFVIMGVALSGVLPILVMPSVRKAFSKNIPKLKPLAPLFIGIEMANLAALYMSQRAVDLGSPSLASAMETTVPGYTFLLTILLLSLKHRFGNEEARYQLRTKLVLVGIMVAGVMQLT
jgi:drug/metabolite transporter (DMT)-like permease